MDWGRGDDLIAGSLAAQPIRYSLKKLDRRYTCYRPKWLRFPAYTFSRTAAPQAEDKEAPCADQCTCVGRARRAGRQTAFAAAAQRDGDVTEAGFAATNAADAADTAHSTNTTLATSTSVSTSPRSSARASSSTSASRSTTTGSATSTRVAACATGSRHAGSTLAGAIRAVRAVGFGWAIA